MDGVIVGIDEADSAELSIGSGLYIEFGTLFREFGSSIIPEIGPTF